MGATKKPEGRWEYCGADWCHGHWVELKSPPEPKPPRVRDAQGREQARIGRLVSTWLRRGD